MGVVERFEQRLSGLVEGAFAKVFKAEVQPVELAKALEREADLRRTVVAADRTLTVNAFTITLGERDYARLRDWAEPLTRELAEMVREHAAAERYAFAGPVTVDLGCDPSVATGTFRLTSRVAPADVTAGAGPALGLAHPPPATGRPRLVGPDGQEHPITKPVMVIGRGAQADIALTDTGVSRRHAQILVADDEVEIVDAGSTNGTLVNGIAAARARLRDGDQLTFGTTTLVFRRDED